MRRSSRAALSCSSEAALTKKQKAAAKKAAAAAAAGGGKATITIPPIDGKKASEYAAALTKLKLKPALSQATAAAPVGKVLRVTPEPGEKVKKGAKITVRASGGSPPLAVENERPRDPVRPVSAKQTASPRRRGQRGGPVVGRPGENQASTAPSRAGCGGLGKGARNRVDLLRRRALGAAVGRAERQDDRRPCARGGDGDLVLGRIDRRKSAIVPAR